MRIQSVDSYRSPKIPTRDYINDHPEILNHIPYRWLSDTMVLTALAGTVMLISTTTGHTVSRKPVRAKMTPISNKTDIGSTVTMGDVISPVFLSEADARVVIRREAAKSGILFDISDKSKPTVKVPIGTNKQGKHESAIINLDGVDKKRKIYFEVVSPNDVNWFHAMKISSPSYTGDIRNDASELRNKLRKAYPRGLYGVFYNPPIYPSEYMNITVKRSATELANSQKLANTRVKRLLRAQVKDFIKWLKAEGVI